MLDPLERFSIQAIRIVQALGEQPQPLRALLFAQRRLLGRRGGARGGTRHASSLPGRGWVEPPVQPAQETRAANEAAGAVSCRRRLRARRG